MNYVSCLYCRKSILLRKKYNPLKDYICKKCKNKKSIIKKLLNK